MSRENKPESGPYAEVAVVSPAPGTYSYAVPENIGHQLAIGRRVRVPFGRTERIGYVLGFHASAGPYAVKRILDIPATPSLFPPDLIPLFRWASDYYLCPLGELIHSVLPRGDHQARTELSITEKGRQARQREFLTPPEKAVLAHLETDGPCTAKALKGAVAGALSQVLLDQMETRGYLQKIETLKGNNPAVRQERWARLLPHPPTLRLTPAQAEVIAALNQAGGEISIRGLNQQVARASSRLAGLEKKGLVERFERERSQDPFGEPIPPDRPPALTPAQQAVLSQVLRGDTGFAPYLLAGVTGSGKTELYLQLAAHFLSQGKTVLALVPEIALITQVERRFRARFGERVAVLHSGLSQGQRYHQWIAVCQGRRDIVVGARSAIFAPLRDLGLVIVDEEHDASYKQDHKPLYHARDLAVVRAKLSRAAVVLGSATPSMQSYSNCQQGKFIELRLDERIQARPLPTIEVTDLRQYRDRHQRDRLLSPDLSRAIARTLERGEQALLFLNRRGFASFPVCAVCGEPLRCQHCDITLTYHQADARYQCHFCGFQRPGESHCPVCGARDIKRLGMGTEKLHKGLESLFPQARIARLDRDTTHRKGELVRILKSVRDRETDILIGTQMVAKGHDFPHITLVGILCADMSLNLPDFRAGERTFQLLAQVAGRAGRGSQPGRVILQTYNPAHFCIAAASQQDFRAFYQQEIGFRRALNYPPFSRMAAFRISGKDKDRTRAFARALGESCQQLRRRSVEFTRALAILGPVEAPIARLESRYRWQILFKCQTAGILHRFLRRILDQARYLPYFRQTRLITDVDPFHLL